MTTEFNHKTLSGPDLKDELLERGRALFRAGLRPEDVAIDLDETAWDWCYPIFRQPDLIRAHWEHIFLRRPLLWLLRGLVDAGRAPIRLWTAGYGLRIDKIASLAPEFASISGLQPGSRSELAAHVVTRLDFLRAFRAEPGLIPNPDGRWIAEKVPGMPTRAGKPAIDATKVLLDDRETNCRRFVGAGGGRSAIWLRGTPRIATDNLPLYQVKAPPRHQWAHGVADAFASIAAGRGGLFVVDPVPGGPERESIAINLPHGPVFRDWINPGREVARALSRRKREEAQVPAAS